MSDPFSIALRGEYFHDEKGFVLGTSALIPTAGKNDAKTDIEDGTLSLNYAFGSHLAFMIDARYDTASTPDAPSGFPGIFPEELQRVHHRSVHGNPRRHRQHQVGEEAGGRVATEGSRLVPRGRVGRRTTIGSRRPLGARHAGDRTV